MCGRITNYTEVSRIAEHFEVAIPANAAFTPRYNIAPTQPILTVGLVRNNNVKRTVAFPKWGLIPEWARDNKRININAKAETVANLPTFSEAFHLRRCLFVMDGFYEWKKVGKGKTEQKYPFHFHLPNHEPFAAAGLWEFHEEYGFTCCLITTTPNEVTAPVHDRMPVILPPSAYNAWLNREASTTDLQALLVPYAGELERTAVGSYVGNSRNEGPKCLEPDTDLFTSVQVA